MPIWKSRPSRGSETYKGKFGHWEFMRWCCDQLSGNELFGRLTPLMTCGISAVRFSLTLQRFIHQTQGRARRLGKWRITLHSLDSDCHRTSKTRRFIPLKVGIISSEEQALQPLCFEQDVVGDSFPFKAKVVQLKRERLSRHPNASICVYRLAPNNAGPTRRTTEIVAPDASAYTLPEGFLERAPLILDHPRLPIFPGIGHECS